MIDGRLTSSFDVAMFLSLARSMYKGRELEDKMSLADSGVPDEDGVSIVVVRKQLVAEGWKLRFEDNEDSDTEDEDF